MVYGLVVIYNKKCEDSITLRCLEKYRDKIQILVFDNSTKPFSNDVYCKKHHYSYYTLRENVGLSKAYNYVIRNLDKKSDDYIMIFDDDTYLNDEYFEEVFSNLPLHYDILLPTVLSNQKILSPSHVQFQCRVQRVSSIEKLNLKKVTAINSGMVVRLQVYDHILYDENLFLDYVDHFFMRKIRKHNYSICILNSCLVQSFSRDEKNSLDGALFRFKIFKKDFRFYCFSGHHYFFYYLSLWKFVLSYTIRYKTLAFIKNV